MTTLPDVLGDRARVRILEVFLAERDDDLNATDIARHADLHRSTIYHHLDALRAYGLIVQTRTAGNSPMYQLNGESELATILVGFRDAIQEGSE